jgi:hypothetical protein
MRRMSFQDSEADGSCNCSADGNIIKNSIGVQAFMQTILIVQLPL